MNDDPIIVFHNLQNHQTNYFELFRAQNISNHALRTCTGETICSILILTSVGVKMDPRKKCTKLQLAFRLDFNNSFGLCERF